MNFKSTVSRNSIGSSLATERDKPSSEEEVHKLTNEIINIKQVIESMKITLASKDAIIKEREKFNEELKSAHRTIRNLRQQLLDERDIYSNEKEHLNEEITRLTKRINEGQQLHLSAGIDKPSTISVNEEYLGKDKIIYNLCSRYIKMKKSKFKLHAKIDHLIVKNNQVFENILHILEENKDCLDSLLQMLLYSSKITPGSAKYLNLLKFNAQLHFENTRLKILLKSHEIGRDKVCDKSNLIFFPKQNSGPMLQKQQHNYFKMGNKFRSLHKSLNPHVKHNTLLSHSDTCILNSKFKLNKYN